MRETTWAVDVGEEDFYRDADFPWSETVLQVVHVPLDTPMGHTVPHVAPEAADGS